MEGAHAALRVREQLPGARKLQNWDSQLPPAAGRRCCSAGPLGGAARRRLHAHSPRVARPAPACRRTACRSHTRAPPRPPPQAGGRRLLQDCTVLGSVGVGGSIAILLLIGFVAGAGATWLFFWLKERRQVRIEVGAANGRGL